MWCAIPTSCAGSSSTRIERGSGRAINRHHSRLRSDASRPRCKRVRNDEQHESRPRGSRSGTIRLDVPSADLNDPITARKKLAELSARHRRRIDKVAPVRWDDRAPCGSPPGDPLRGNASSIQCQKGHARTRFRGFAPLPGMLESPFVERRFIHVHEQGRESLQNPTAHHDTLTPSASSRTPLGRFSE